MQKRCAWMPLVALLLGLVFPHVLLASPGMCVLDNENDPNDQALWKLVTSTVSIPQELMITERAVVNDRTRTFDVCANDGNAATPGGPWTFGALMKRLAGSQKASTFVLNWLKQWSTSQQVNGFTVSARTSVQQKIIDKWPRTSTGELDIDRSPFRLLAIVARFDLRHGIPAGQVGSAGEGRFVFGYYDPTSCSASPAQFTVIFEYKLPMRWGTASAVEWAWWWHDLDFLAFGGDSYLKHLQTLTDTFATRANLSQVRTNEIFLASPWELREFKLASDGALRMDTVKMTPDLSINNTQPLADFINQNEQAIIAGSYSLPTNWVAGAITASTSSSNAWARSLWTSGKIKNATARQQFAINTCNGCHTVETAASFLHVQNRTYSSSATLSGFLVGKRIDTFDFHVVADPATGQSLRFNDLDCRALDYYQLLANTQASRRERPSSRVH